MYLQCSRAILHRFILCRVSITEWKSSPNLSLWRTWKGRNFQCLLRQRKAFDSLLISSLRNAYTRGFNVELANRSNLFITSVCWDTWQILRAWQIRMWKFTPLQAVKIAASTVINRTVDAFSPTFLISFIFKEFAVMLNLTCFMRALVCRESLRPIKRIWKWAVKRSTVGNTKKRKM